jgi:pimeloyl-ACP methyl ester carboxylesterase
MSNSPPEKVVHLNRYHHFTEVMRDPGIEGQLRRYKSAHDGTSQTVFMLQPVGRKPDKLFFFFHGMDGDSGDAVVVGDIVKRLNATVVAMGGRGPAWVSTAFLADAEQVIRKHANGFQGFHLIGVSMGGSQALALAGLLPDDLRQSILGVIALIPGANLPAILERSNNERVKSTLQASVNGEISLAHERSPTRILEQYNAGLPFIIFYRQEDTLLLADELVSFIAILRRRGHSVMTFSASGEHEFTYKNFDYVEVMRRLGSDSTEYGAPLRSDEQ